MTRKTETPDARNNISGPSQFELDKFWGWIDGAPATEEMWRVQANGDMVLVVDEATLIEILSDDTTKAYEDFSAYEEHSPEAQAWEWIDLPYELLGTYTIKGVYDANQKLVDGERTYFFSQEF